MSFQIPCLDAGNPVAREIQSSVIAFSLKMLAEALKQLVDQPGLRQRLAKQPDRGGIRHRVLELQIEKAHERYAVADQVLSPIVSEIVERLQHHDLQLQDLVEGLPAGVD